MELVQACILQQVCFSRPDLDENKLLIAKGMCLARKTRDKEVFILLYRELSIL